MTEEDAMAYWLGEGRDTFVAEEDGDIVGTYFLRPNQAGGGRHICNCGYMTRADASGRGIALQCDVSALARLRTATRLLWDAVQLRRQRKYASRCALDIFWL